MLLHLSAEPSVRFAISSAGAEDLQGHLASVASFRSPDLRVGAFAKWLPQQPWPETLTRPSGK